MVIVTGGLHRSGTTWLYNVLRILYPEYKCFFAETFPIDFTTNSIIKAHNWDNSFVNAKVIRIVRDIRNVAASFLAFEPLRQYYDLNHNNIVDHLNSIIHQESENWKEDLLLKYENSKLENISKIINFLNIDADPLLILTQVEAIKHPTTSRDLTTEFWPNHISNSNYKNLPQSLNKYLEHNFNWWLTKYEYI